MTDSKRGGLNDLTSGESPEGTQAIPPLRDKHLTINLAFGSGTGLGGTERRMLDVAAELHSRGILVRAIVPTPRDQPFHAAMANAGAQLVQYNHPVGLLGCAVTQRADATWAFGARAAYPLAVGRRSPFWHGGQLLVAKNGLEALRTRRSMVLERTLIPCSDLVVANSQAAADLTTTRSRVPVERIRVLPSALPEGWFSTRNRRPRSAVRIAMVGNARPEKEHALGIRTFARLNEAATVLDVFTDDQMHLRADLARLSQDLRRRVTIHEGVSVTPAVMRSVDVLLHPSSSESLPRVALEARSQGAWVVGFDVGDLSQYCQTRIPWGDEVKLVASLRVACRAVRAGDWPAPIRVPSVPGYTDRLLTMIRELSEAPYQGTAA